MACDHIQLYALHGGEYTPVSCPYCPADRALVARVAGAILGGIASRRPIDDDDLPSHAVALARDVLKWVDGE